MSERTNTVKIMSVIFGVTVAIGLYAIVTDPHRASMATSASAAELPKCGDTEVLKTLEGLQKQFAKSQINDGTAIVLLQQALIERAMAGKDISKLPPGVDGPFSPALVAAINKMVDERVATYSGVREESTNGNIKFCAADVQIDGKSLWGEPVNIPGSKVTYSVQLTEDGQTYVSLLSDVGAGQQAQDPVANQLELLRQQQEEQYHEQEQRQRKRDWQRDYDRAVESPKKYQRELEEQLNQNRY
jgi:hypothetical protein